MAGGVVQTRPSGAHRWTQCSAAPQFASRHKGAPPLDGADDAANEGTCAAWLAAEALQGRALLCSDLLGCAEPLTGWIVDAAMVGHIQNYVDMIRAEGGELSAERFVTLSDRVAGTLDNSATYADGVIRVRDLKYGFRLIEADAVQLVIYAGGLLAEILEKGGAVREVWTEIYQPRGFHVDGVHRRKLWTPAEILEKCRWVAERAEECYKPNPIATPGAHCLECDGATGCQALESSAQNLVALIEDTRFRDATGGELAMRLEQMRAAKKIVDALSAALETETLARCMGGEYIPGWGMKEKFGNKKFTHSKLAIQALTGVNPVKEVLMSPAELRAAGVPLATINALTSKTPSGHKLTKIDDADLARQFKRI